MSYTIYPHDCTRIAREEYYQDSTIRVEGRVSKEYINHLLMKKERGIALSNAEQELLSLLP